MKRRGKKFRHRTQRAVAALLPNLLTLGNAICGFGAIVFIAGAASDWSPEEGLLIAFADGKLQIACWLIFAAMIFDALDGSVARMTRQTSNLGAQLDSLCDAVTFAVAPAFLVWKLIALLPHSVIHIPQKVAWVLAVLYLACGILRLARFNIETAPDEKKHDGFHGLPTPAAAAVIASLTLLAVDILVEGGEAYVWATQAFFLAIPIIAFFLGILMVSRVPYPHTVNRFLRGRRSFSQLVQVVFFLAVLALIPLPLAFSLISSAYVGSGLLAYARRKVAAAKPEAAPAEILENTE